MEHLWRIVVIIRLRSTGRKGKGMARYTHSSDNKGRIFIPAKLRDSLGRSVYVTRSLDAGYLAVYTDEQFAMIKAQIYQLPGTDPIARRFRREIIGEAIHCNMDSQGRISISEELWREIDVKPGDDVYVTDMGDTFEICSRAFYDKKREEEVPITELDLSAYDVKGIV